MTGLELADCSGGPTDADAIDVLIGSDFYWKFVSGEVHQGSAGPVAIQSKFGWLLSGLMDPAPVSDATCTHLILASPSVITIPEVQDPVQDMLHKFWDTESIGVLDTDHTKTDEFLSCVQFHDKHYEILLPWKEGHYDSPIISLSA